jgi:hypothetical protein
VFILKGGKRQDKEELDRQIGLIDNDRQPPPEKLHFPMRDWNSEKSSIGILLMSFPSTPVWGV